MGFSLTIQEGKEPGRQYVFEQAEVSIGRTAENDVVLGDPGVSRKHALIRFEGGRFFAQDQGSANGTQVNGNPLEEESELQSGDLITLGPVVMAFEVSEGNSTRILDVSAGLPPPAKKKPAAASEEGRKKTMAIQPSSSSASRRPAPVAKPAAPASRPKPQAAPLSASERARLQRENQGLKGKINLFLMDKPPAVKYGIFGGAGAVALVIVGLVINSLIPSGPKMAAMGDQSKVVWDITDKETRSKVFGYGVDGVSVQTRDEAHFKFDYSDAFPTVYYVRFEGVGIDRKEAVDITLNGTHIGFVNPGMGDYTKEQRLRLPKKYLSASTENELIFDDVANPPGNEPWAIRRVRLEIKPVPKGTPGELMQTATKQYELADQRWSMKNVAAQNRYEARVALLTCLLALEGVDPKPDLYQAAQQLLREVEREMDDICNKTLLAAKKAEMHNDFRLSMQELKSGLQWFPGDDHSCRDKLVTKILDAGGDPNK